MSGNRANAAARQRRAGGDAPPQQVNIRPGGGGRGVQGRGQGQQQYQQQPQQQQQQQAPKLSISDAIALITLRLGRVETYIQKNQLNGGNQSSNDEYVMEHDDNARIIDEEVFNNIISRLDAVERGHKILAERPVAPAANLKSAVVNTPVPAISNTQSSSEITVLNEYVRKLQSETVELKDLLLKLQSFTMDVNQRLLDQILNNENDLNNVLSGFVIDNNEMFEVSDELCVEELEDNKTDVIEIKKEENTI